MYVSDIDKKSFSSIILLDEIINKERVFTAIAQPDDKVLESLLVELLSKGYLTVGNNKYSVTQKGQEAFDLFMKRYSEYLKIYDIYGFVDLEKGEFAFSKYFDFDTDAAWDKFKMDNRFDDVRLAVAIFKKLNPAEIVFMSFINENRFDTESTGWQMDLVSSAIWNEIDHICDTAIKPSELGDDVIQDIIEQGANLLTDILKEEAKRNEEEAQNNAANNNNQVQETVVEETTYYDNYYEPYYDPYYVSPFWLLPLFLW